MMNETVQIRNAFNAHAHSYAQAAKIQQEIGERLFERLHYLKLTPRYVLDLGCGPGSFTPQLKKQYPDAHVVGLDLAYQMLTCARDRQSWRRKWSLVNADMTALPFESHVFDLVFANQVIHWSHPLSRVMSEVNRVLRPEGCLMFSTLGPDTFCELRQAFATADKYAHVNVFPDMHDVGDALMAHYFLDPVVDMEKIMGHYKTLSDLLRALKAQGVRNINPARHAGLTGKHAWRQFEQAMALLRTSEGQYPLTYEVVYGHAWKGTQRRVETGVETVISVSALRKEMTLKRS